jgi:hypothetical protein
MRAGRATADRATSAAAAPASGVPHWMATSRIGILYAV